MRIYVPRLLILAGCLLSPVSMAADYSDMYADPSQNEQQSGRQQSPPSQSQYDNHSSQFRPPQRGGQQFDQRGSVPCDQQGMPAQSDYQQQGESMQRPPPPRRGRYYQQDNMMQGQSMRGQRRFQQQRGQQSQEENY